MTKRLSLEELTVERVKALEGMLTAEEIECLSALASQAAGGVLVEIGSYRGKSAAALALGSAHGAGQAVYAVDPHEEFHGALGGTFGEADRAGFFETMLATGAYRLVRPIDLTSREAAAGWRRPVALLFIDGDHRYEAVLSDIESWRPHLTADAIVVFDDVNRADLGPRRVAEQLLASGEFRMAGQAGKIWALRRNSGAARREHAADPGDLEGACLRRNTYVSRRHRLLYVSVAKAACTAMKHALAQLEGEVLTAAGAPESWEVEADLMVHDRQRWRTPSLADLGPSEQEEVLGGGGYFRFALVRNPFTRVFSAWQSKLLLREPLQAAAYHGAPFYGLEIESQGDIARAFEGFLEFVARHEHPRIHNEHWAPQAALLLRHRIRYDCIGKVEDLSGLLASLATHLARFDAALPPLARRNESLIAWDPAYLTPRAAELIRELYAEDFSVLGYSRDPPGAAREAATGDWRAMVAAFRMIRARHERFGAVRARLAEQSLRIRMLDASLQALSSERTAFRRFVNRMLARITGLRVVRGAQLERAAQVAADAVLDGGERT